MTGLHVRHKINKKTLYLTVQGNTYGKQFFFLIEEILETISGVSSLRP